MNVTGKCGWMVGGRNGWRLVRWWVIGYWDGGGLDGWKVVMMK